MTFSDDNEKITMRRPRRIVRLRSASSQLPELSNRWWWPCPRVKMVAWYMGWLVIFLFLLSFNNIVLLYMQQNLVNSNINKFPGRAHQILVEEESPLAPPHYTKASLGRHVMGTNHESPEPTRPGVNNALHDAKPRPSTRQAAKFRVTAPQPLKSLNHEGAKVVQSPTTTTTHPETHKGITPNEILQKSALIVISSKTVDGEPTRNCQIQLLVKSFRRDYVDIRLYISESIVHPEYCSQKDIICVDSAGCWSNACVNNLLVNTAYKNGHSYLFVWESHYTYHDGHTLALLAKRFVESQSEIISPCISSLCNSTKGLLHRHGNEVSVLPSLQLLPVSHPDSLCQQSHVLPPVMLAATSTLLTHRWDSTLDAGEHADLLLAMQNKRINSAVCLDVMVEFTMDCSDGNIHTNVTKFEKNWLNMPLQAFRKWNITSFYNGLGLNFHIKRSTVQTASAKWVPMQFPPSSLEKKLTDDLVLNMNDYTPGWMNVRTKNLSLNKLYYKNTSPCVTRVNGSLVVEYERHHTFNNKELTLHIDTHHINRSCPILQQYWRMSQYGKLKRRQIYYVIALSNDTEYMTRLLKLVNAQLEKRYTNIIVVDMGRSGSEQFNMSHMKLDVSAYYLYLGSPFSRSIGLKKGFNFAQQVAQQRSHDDPILFAIDTSMVIPNDFTRRVWRGTRCNISTYAPICYKELGDGDDGYWVQYGYGMIGVCASDYNRSQGWDSRWGYHWGAEDVDLIHRLQDLVPYTVRIKEPDYTHKHSGENRNKEYYKQKNIYFGELPITPETKLVTDITITNSLVKYALKRMKYRVELKLTAIYMTSLPHNNGVQYDLRFQNHIHEDYFALINSL